MTSENRMLIELGDLAEIEFECPNPKCEAKVTYPLASPPGRLMDKCPNCFEPFYTPVPPIPQRDPVLCESLLRWIEQLCKLRDNKDVKAKLRFHVKMSA
jgi:hypothetical protein